MKKTFRTIIALLWVAILLMIALGVSVFGSSGTLTVMAKGTVTESTSLTATSPDLAEMETAIDLSDSKNRVATNSQATERDTDQPTLTASINSGVLNVEAQDATSEIAAIYVNGYRFSALSDGSLTVRLQQFDSGYPAFTIQAMDVSGNMSETYNLENPYYVEAGVTQDTAATEDTVVQLPASAVATEPETAKATVTDYTAQIEPDSETTGESNLGTGKEFYTIQTKEDKVFYLIIDKDQTENNVYFLTEVSENDLLNVTDAEIEVLPQNAAVVEGALPTDEGAGNEGEKSQTAERQDVEPATNQGGDDIANETNPAAGSNMSLFIMMGAVLLIVGGAYYYIKFIRGKNNAFSDDEFDEDEEESEVYEPDEENHVSEPDFDDEDAL